MFKFKIAVGFVLLIFVQAAFVVYVFQQELIPLTLEDTDISLQRSATMIEKSHRLDEFALQEKARFVASRQRLRRAMVDDYEGDWQSERHRAVHKHLETEHIRFTEFMAPETEGVRNLNLGLRQRRPLDLDMFMALDENGRLVATLGSGRAHLMGDNIGERFPVVIGAMEGDETVIDMWNWSWRTGADRDLYVVAISPMHDIETGEPIGTVVLGDRVTSDVAERSRALISDGLGTDTVSTMDSRAQTQAPHIAFFRGDTIYSSTLRSRQISELTDEIFDRHAALDRDEPEQIMDITIENTNYRSIIRYFPGQFETNNPAGVILLSNRDAAVAPIRASRSQVLFVTGTIALIGLGLIFYFFQVFLKPLARLEEGVQEILSGDKDYVFEPDENHEVADNLARHLNLLSAFLQGKPMPDEEHSLGGWDSFDAGGDDGGSSKPSSVAGVPMNIGGKRKKASDDDEKDGRSAGDKATTEENT